MESTLAFCAPTTQCTKLWSVLQPRGPIRRDQDQQHLPQFRGYWGQKAPCTAPAMALAARPGAEHSTQEHSGVRGTAGAGCRHSTPGPTGCCCEPRAALAARSAGEAGPWQAGAAGPGSPHVSHCPGWGEAGRKACLNTDK